MDFPSKQKKKCNGPLYILPKIPSMHNRLNLKFKTAFCMCEAKNVLNSNELNLIAFKIYSGQCFWTGFRPIQSRLKVICLRSHCVLTHTHTNIHVGSDYTGQRILCCCFFLVVLLLLLFVSHWI